MLRDGFLRFCDNPEIACCKAERELEQLRAENASLRAQLAESQRREKAAVEELKHYLENNEENGVVYVPKFAVEKLINRHGSQEAGKGAT